MFFNENKQQAKIDVFAERTNVKFCRIIPWRYEGRNLTPPSVQGATCDST